MARRTVTTAAPPEEEANNRGNKLNERVPTDGSQYADISNSRNEWWWETGPLISCCFCFSLETGVALMAGLKAVISGVGLLDLTTRVTGETFTTAAQTGMKDVLAELQEKHASRCMAHDPTALSEECQRVKQLINLLQISPRLEWHHLVLVYFIAFLFLVGLAGGIAGLWATFSRNILAAKLFWWSWSANFALEVLHLWIKPQLYDRSMGKSNSLMPSEFGMFVIYYAVKCFFLAYFMKVSWSYYELLRIRGAKKEPDLGGDVELREISDESSSNFV